jgi:hypothetical protein
MKIVDGQIGRRAVVIVFFALSELILMSAQIRNGFGLFSGDRYDAVIVATVLEHWKNVFLNGAPWDQLYYFYPYQHTLAQTDGYLVSGILSIPFRVVGLDVFSSAFWALQTFRAIGYFSVYVLATKSLGLAKPAGIFAAILFTISSGLFLHDQRLQLASIAIAPLITLMVHQSFKSFVAGRTTRSLVFSLFAAIIFGCWLLTCFYASWFFIYFVFVFALVQPLKLANIAKRLSKKMLLARYVLPNLFMFALAALPFASIYLPKSLEVGTREWESVSQNTIPLVEIFQTDTKNYFFDLIFRHVYEILIPEYQPKGEYSTTGFSVFVVASFIFACFLAFRGNAHLRSWRPFLIATFVVWATLLKFGDFSLWFFVYNLVPGAKALNAVGALQLFLVLPLALMAAKTLQVCRLRNYMKAAVALVFVLGELSASHPNLNPQDEMARVEQIKSAPSSCEVFYVSGWKNQSTVTPMVEWVNEYYAHNVTAMLVAERIQLPTINGVASFNPPDWNFGFPNADDYVQRVEDYSTKHSINRICALDLNSKEWTEK